MYDTSTYHKFKFYHYRNYYGYYDEIYVIICGTRAGYSKGMARHDVRIVGVDVYEWDAEFVKALKCASVFSPSSQLSPLIKPVALVLINIQAHDRLITNKYFQKARLMGF